MSWPPFVCPVTPKGGSPSPFQGRSPDVSPENDGSAKLEYADGFDGPPHERTGPMKRSKFSEEQVADALRQAESGTPVGDVCRQLGVSEAQRQVMITAEAAPV